MSRQIAVLEGRVARIVVAIIIFHGAILAYSAWQHSPVVGEVNHLPAGLSHLHFSSFDLFRVNPPLVRSIAAIPVALMKPQTDWRRYDSSPLARSDLEVSQDFLTANGVRSLFFFTVARWACIPFSLIGAFICFRWASELYGQNAGFTALILWCSCPFVLGHASLITPDAHAAAMGVTAYYCFWRWLNHSSFFRATIAGVTLGIAQLTKFTLLAFYPLWISTWIIYQFIPPQAPNRRRWHVEAAMLLWAFFLSLLLINLGYNFDESFQPIGEFRFKSQLLNGMNSDPEFSRFIGNRFTNVWSEHLPVPVPADYLQGIDTQTHDFERKMRSYLAGEWKSEGWWHYYLYALAIKLPLGTLCLVAMSTFCLFLKRYRRCWRNELVVLLPAFAIMFFVSSQTGFSIHSRYILPILPFIYIWCSKVTRSAGRHNLIFFASSVALCWSFISSFWVYPHNLSYFNEIAGGPSNGHLHLLDSNIAWGQDLYYLKQWYDAHPDARPFHLAFYGLMDPKLAGIEFDFPSGVGKPADQNAGMPIGDSSIQPGWYAIDMNHLHDTELAAFNSQGKWQRSAESGNQLSCFLKSLPVANAGYSISIYHLTSADLDRLFGSGTSTASDSAVSRPQQPADDDDLSAP